MTFFRLAAVALRSYKLGSICPSVLPSFRLSGCFLGIISLDFSGFCQSNRNHYEVVHDNLIFLENFF